MPENTVPEVPSLIQDPNIQSPKVISIQTPGRKVSFDLTKVLAAVGLIITVAVIVLAGMWLWLQSLEKRVEELENGTEIVTPKTTTNSTTATESATPSAY